MPSDIVVLDIGSDSTKIGFASDPAPSHIFPSVVGRPTSGGAPLIGDDALANRSSCTLTHPVYQGVLKTDPTSLEDYRLIVEFAYGLLGVSPDTTLVLLIESCDNTLTVRGKILDILFNVMTTPVLFAFFSLQSTMALYSNSLTTGMVIESGHHTSFAVPIYNGVAVRSAVQRRVFGGQNVTVALSQMLLTLGFNLTSPANMEIVRDIKETCGFASQDFAVDTTNSVLTPSAYEMVYTLPDTTEITLCSERFRPVELLFQPHLINPGLSNPGLSGAAAACLTHFSTSSTPTRAQMSTIVVAGGSTLFPTLASSLVNGTAARVAADLGSGYTLLAPAQYSAWKGASMLVVAQSTDFGLNDITGGGPDTSFVITPDDYADGTYISKCVNQS